MSTDLMLWWISGGFVGKVEWMHERPFAMPIAMFKQERRSVSKLISE